MSIIVTVSSMIIPAIMLFIVGYGMIKRKNVYDDFVNGAKDGFTTVIKVMPTLIGLMVAVGVLRESGFMTDLGNALGKFTDSIGFPGQLMPVTIVKIFSSSAATGMVLDIFKEYGPDSYTGNVVSLMMSSTETVFYTMSVYFMAAKVTKTRWTLSGALISTLTGTVASVILQIVCRFIDYSLINIFANIISGNIIIFQKIFCFLKRPAFIINANIAKRVKCQGIGGTTT